MLVSDDTILRIAGNKKALDALDEETRGDILELRTEIEARKRNEEEETRRRKAEEELDRRRREADMENKRREFLCVGQWGEKVPPERRFALCKRISKRFEGTCERERKDPSKWVDEEEWCAIDLVRGYKNPYFGYWRYWQDNGIHQIWKENIGPILNLFRINAMQAAADRISMDWNFFDIGDDEKDWQFWVMDYEVGDDGRVKITGDGKYGLATFKEHQRKLREEFGK